MNIARNRLQISRFYGLDYVAHLGYTITVKQQTGE